MTLHLPWKRRARALAASAVLTLIVCSAAGAAGGDPRAADDFATTTIGVGVGFNVLANDVDPEGESLRVVQVDTFSGADPLLLALFLDANGDVFVVPRAPHTGVFSFRYLVEDETGHVGKAKAFVSVRAVDVPTVTGRGEFQTGTGRVQFELSVGPAGEGFAGTFHLQRFRGANISFDADTIDSLAGTGPDATMTGTGTWSGSPGYSFTAHFVEKGDPGAFKGDQIGIEIRDPAGDVVFTTGGTTALSSGNVGVL